MEVGGAHDDGLDRALEEEGLSADEFGLYSLIYYFGPLTSSQIARWSGMPPTTVSAMTKRLANRGHLEHRAHPADGRSRLLSLSERGRETVVHYSGRPLSDVERAEVRSYIDWVRDRRRPPA